MKKQQSLCRGDGDDLKKHNKGDSSSCENSKTTRYGCNKGVTRAKVLSIFKVEDRKHKRVNKERKREHEMKSQMSNYNSDLPSPASWLLYQEAVDELPN